MNEFYKKLFFIALPIVIRTTISSFSGFIDNLMVGQLGTNSISAVSIINQILFVFICSVTGATAGASIFSTQYFGAKDYKGVKNVFQIKFILSIFVFLIFSVFLFVFYDKLIYLFMSKGDEYIKNDITSSCNEYLFFSFISLIPFAINNIFSSTISESGNTLKPMIICLSCTILNTFLNYCFIDGHLGFSSMGIYGASLATFISRFIEMVLMIILAFKTEFFKGFLSKINIELSLLKNIILKSIPLFIDDFLFSFSFVVGVSIYSLQNIDNITIMSITSIVSLFFVNLMVSLGIASEIVLGHELGQNNLEKANNYAFKIIYLTIFLSIFLSFFMYLLSFLVPKFYNIDEILKINITKCIQVFSFTFIITSLSVVIFFILRSGGNTLILSLIDGVFIWLIELPLQYILTRFTTLELSGIYFIILLSAILKVLIGLIFIKRKIWLNKLKKK